MVLQSFKMYCNCHFMVLQLSFNLDLSMSISINCELKSLPTLIIFQQKTYMFLDSYKYMYKRIIVHSIGNKPIY